MGAGGNLVVDLFASVMHSNADNVALAVNFQSVLIGFNECSAPFNSISSLDLTTKYGFFLTLAIYGYLRYPIGKQTARDMSLKNYKTGAG